MASTIADETCEAKSGAWRVTEVTTPATETSPAIPVRRWPITVTVSAEAAIGAAKAQYTTSLPSKVTAGTASWLDWPSGAVAAGTSKREIFAGPVTGVRCVSTTGIAIMEVVQ